MNYTIFEDIKKEIINKKIDNSIVEDNFFEAFISFKNEENKNYILLIPKTTIDINTLYQDSLDYFEKYLDIKKSHVSFKKDSIYLYF